MRCKGTTNFWIVQIFWQIFFNKILQSYPKLSVFLLIISELHFLSTRKVFQNINLLINYGYIKQKRRLRAAQPSFFLCLTYKRPIFYFTIVPWALNSTPFLMMMSLPSRTTFTAAALASVFSIPSGYSPRRQLMARPQVLVACTSITPFSKTVTVPALSNHSEVNAPPSFKIPATEP